MELDEITKAIEGSIELRDGVNKYVLASESGKTVLDNYAQKHWDDNIGPEVKKVHTRYDDDIFTITGKRKEPNEKSYDFLKKELQGLFDGQGDDGSKYKQEIIDLKEKLENAGKDGDWHTTYLSDSVKWKGEKEAFQKQINGFESSKLAAKIESEISFAKSKIKLMDTIPDDMKEVLMTEAVRRITDKAKMEDGKLVLYKSGADGDTIWTDDKYDKITPEGALNELLKTAIETKKPTGGNGKRDADGNIITEGEGDNAKKTLNLDMNKIITRADFTKELDRVTKLKNIQRGSKEYIQLEQNTMTKYGIAKL